MDSKQQTQLINIMQWAKTVCGLLIDLNPRQLDHESMAYAYNCGITPQQFVDDIDECGQWTG